MAKFTEFELKEFDTSTLTANFQNLDTALTHAAKEVHIFNTSSVDVYISSDGTSNTLRIPASKELTVSAFDTDYARSEGSYVFKAKTQLKIKRVTAAAAGSVIVHIFT